MKITSLKTILPIIVIVLGFIIFQLITHFGKPESLPKVIDPRPVVSAQTIKPQRYQVKIQGFGSLEPLEQTSLAPQVSGEVVAWHPQLVEGGIVKRGDILFTLDKTTYEAAYMQAEANVASAEANLTEQKAMAQVARDEAASNPQKQYTDFFLRKPQLQSAEASVKSALASLKIAKRDLDNCKVYAPFDALVVSRDFGLGQYLVAASPVAILSNVERAKLIVPIPSSDAEFLPDQLNGAQATIRIPGSKQTAYAGQIRHAINSVDRATRMTQIFVEVVNPLSQTEAGRSLKFGDYLEVEFAGRLIENVVLLPQDLVNAEGVWLLGEDEKLTKAKVDVIRHEGDRFLIGSGLNESDLVVMTPPEYPSEGMQVRTVKDKDNVSTSLSDQSQEQALGDDNDERS